MSDYFLADDLSGALDAAAAFHHVGRRVRIVLAADAWDEAEPDEVVAITTETRNEETSRAANLVAGVLAEAKRRGARLLYKKIDSTLRGPVAAELRAVLAALPGTRVLFAPANPRVGRTVRGGLLLVGGVPVAETPFGRDPGSPLRSSSVREILGAAVTERVVIPDVETESDLVASVVAMDATGNDWIGIGSGALAVSVAARGIRRDRSHVSGNDTAKPIAISPSNVSVPPRLLLIGGSAHPLNRVQSAALAAGAAAPVHELSFGDPEGTARAIVASFARSRAVVVTMPEIRVARLAALEAMVDAAERTMTATEVRRVFVTGGETAYALCVRLGVRSLAFDAEIEPGVAVATGVSRVGPVRFAVKPGGFGDEQTWIRAWRHLCAT